MRLVSSLGPETRGGLSACPKASGKRVWHRCQGNVLAESLLSSKVPAPAPDGAGTLTFALCSRLDASRVLLVCDNKNSPERS